MSANELDKLLAQAIAPEAGSAAVLLASKGGEPVVRRALGVTRRWDALGVPTTTAEHAVTEETIFDLASITKPLVAAALLTELDVRGSDPSLPVSELLPEFQEPGLREITVLHLLSHTAGFPTTWPDRTPDPRAERYRKGARPLNPPGVLHRYSCMSFIWAGLLAESLSGLPLDAFVQQNVLDPLGMRETSYRPVAALRERIAATEFQPGRGMVQGVVHDETAWALGGVAGNAGIFGPAPDLLRFAEAVRTGAGFTPRVHAWFTEPISVAVDGGSTYLPTMGLRSDEAWCAATPLPSVSHTGFTGTAFSTEPGGDWSIVLLTNRVHPSRDQGTVPKLRAPIVAAAVNLA